MMFTPFAFINQTIESVVPSTSYYSGGENLISNTLVDCGDSNFQFITISSYKVTIYNSGCTTTKSAHPDVTFVLYANFQPSDSNLYFEDLVILNGAASGSSSEYTSNNGCDGSSRTSYVNSYSSAGTFIDCLA